VIRTIDIQEKIRNNGYTIVKGDYMARYVRTGIADEKYIVAIDGVESLPLRAYIHDAITKDEICGFLVTKDAPKIYQDIVSCDKRAIPFDAKEMLIKQAFLPGTKIPKLTRWDVLNFICESHLHAIPEEFDKDTSTRLKTFIRNEDDSVSEVIE
jgi:hypothetical protein